MNRLNVLQFGLGPIGLEIVRKAVDVHGLSLVGAVDINPEFTDKDAGVLAGISPVGTKVTADLSSLDKKQLKGAVAIHCTGSDLSAVWPQIKELLDCGCSVVSTCEELSYPWHRHPELAGEIDAYAREKGAAVIGTGVNPGFVMDTMTLCLTAVTNTFGDIRAVRKVDVSRRRIPLQKKTGCGMTVEEFELLAERDAIGHVGLEESARLIAYGLGLELKKVTNTISPVVAERQLELTSGTVEPGLVCGQYQVVNGEAADGRKITLELTMAAGAEQEDRVQVGGNEGLEMVIPDGIFGDTATAAMAINTAKRIGAGRFSGLLTMADLPLPLNAGVRKAASESVK
ncbi:NAD(P)H-dependent amine dehydrogenase family protein [Alteribacter natronophilus]|uniref:NAD(P)H-dependent amine dehydrogenase family protein n=1 Tax=Alteribacter natronophilus TaxID=2583810 RepID=UPI00110EDEE1|nr:hypothetical protein [Alteribacter natronophilus]TMW72332.1 hypothetical protein FGB90_08995 [Alteribacter natronophilus]